MICGLIPVLPATLAAITLGVVARHQITQTGERGAGLALGALYILLTVVLIFVMVR